VVTIRPPSFPADCLPTAIGSFPFREPTVPLDAITNRLRDIPIWPQLPPRSPLEGMFTQFAIEMPGLRESDARDRAWIDTVNGEAALEEFYRRVLDADLAPFALTPERAPGFFAFVAAMQRRGAAPVAVKGHVTGPISFGLGVRDQDGRSILYHETFFEAVRASLRLQAAWQVEALRPLAPRVIVFLDEPSLMSFGSAFTQFSKEQAIAWIGDVAGEVRARGGIVGVHCCGNTDWSIVTAAPIDILNFDAYTYFDSLALYPAEVRDFLARGGILACGIVPTQEEHLALGEDADALAAKLIARLATLDVGMPLDLLMQRILITPACGLGTLPEAPALRALDLAAGVSTVLRQGFGLAR
jgi:methionine synthase II (cobalamin-independent)